MRVGLNLLFLIPGETGGRETYVRELTRALRLEQPAVELTAFIGLEAAALKRGTWLEELQTVTIPVHTRSRLAWALSEQTLLPRVAAKAKVGLLHSMATTAPLFGPFRRVVTIHDLLHQRHPELSHPVWRVGTRVIVGGAARTAHRLITASETSRQELISLLHVRPDRIDVVHHGIGTPPANPRTPAPELRARYAMGTRPFVLVSAIRLPHKNLPALADALALIPKERRPLLVLTGPAGSDDERLSARIRAHGLEDDVRTLGWIEQADLEGLFAEATCFVLPTLYEGFGLPVLEAMARDVPVACSDIAVMREVTGDAALLFDPHRPQAIAAAMELLLGSPAERRRLVAAGRTRAASFTWKRAAEGTLSSYERAMQRGRKAQA